MFCKFSVTRVKLLNKHFQYIEVCLFCSFSGLVWGNVKKKGKGYCLTGLEVPEGKQSCSFTLQTSAQNFGP